MVTDRGSGSPAYEIIDSDMVTACPTAVVRAPAAAVWEVLMNLDGYDKWVGANLVSADPAGPIVEGQTIRFRTREMGPWWPVMFRVGPIHSQESLLLTVELPFGIVNREHIVLTPQSPTETRVTFN